MFFLCQEVGSFAYFCGIDWYWHIRSEALLFVSLVLSLTNVLICDLKNVFENTEFKQSFMLCHYETIRITQLAGL